MTLRLYGNVNIREAQLAFNSSEHIAEIRMQEGDRVIHTDSYPDKRYTGWVGYISPTAEFTPKNVQTPELRTRLVYSVRVYACNPQGELRLGMPTTVTIALDQKPSDATANHCGR